MPGRDSPRALLQPAMRLVVASGDRLVFVQRRNGWAAFLASMGVALALTSLMLFQSGRDLPEWLAIPGLGAAMFLLAMAAAAWFSRRMLVISSDDPARAVRLERRTLGGTARRTYSIAQVRGVSMAARPSGKAHVLLLSLGDDKSGSENTQREATMSGSTVFVLGGTEQGFRDTKEAAALGSRIAAVLQCPLLERGTAVYDAGAEVAHVTDLTDTAQRPPGTDQ